MIRHDTSIDIHRPSADVFAALLDLPGYDRWTDMRDSRWLTTGKPRVGSRGQHLTHLTILLDVGSQQGDVGVPLVKVAVAVFLRHGFNIAKVCHVYTARHKHSRNAGARRPHTTFRPGVKDAVADIIRQFCRRQVE